MGIMLAGAALLLMWAESQGIHCWLIYRLINNCLPYKTAAMEGKENPVWFMGFFPYLPRLRLQLHAAPLMRCMIH